jgi:pantoate--beta-alanine ligase
MMLTITDIRALRARLSKWRQQGRRIAAVPTMGNLHAGHMSLVEHARTIADKLVVSIFVNPLQFDRVEDLAAYPRTLKEDCRKLRELATDIAFVPTVKGVYPREMENATRVEVPRLSYVLEGASRPGHFVGVATVVTKLLNIMQPDVAIFGEKDFQQLLIIRRLVVDLNLPIEIIGLCTVREADGLAMSSRNRYLTPEERLKAPALHATLRHVANCILANQRGYANMERQAIHDLREQGFQPDYISVRRAQDLTVPNSEERDMVVLGAVWLGRTRLIDNSRVTLMEHYQLPIISCHS